MLEIIRKNRSWLIANVIGLIIYFCFAIPAWPAIAEQDIPLEFRITSTAGDVAFLISLPLLLFYMGVNFIWLCVISFGTMRGKQRWISLLMWVLVGGIWFFSFIYDHDRATRESPRVEELRAKGVLNFGD